jgi:hypothetical protein
MLFDHARVAVPGPGAIGVSIFRIEFNGFAVIFDRAV